MPPPRVYAPSNSENLNYDCHCLIHPAADSICSSSSGALSTVCTPALVSSGGGASPRNRPPQSAHFLPHPCDAVASGAA